MYTKYKEIFKLQDMLYSAKIPFEFIDRSVETSSCEKMIHYQVIVYEKDDKDKRLISVVEGDYTYGGDEDLLEIMGCLTPEELEEDSVLGHLSAEEVFDRIKTNYGGSDE